MELMNINRFFRRSAENLLRFRWPFLALLAVITILGLAGMGRIKMASSNEGWFDDREQIQIATEEFENRFGNNDTVGILVEADDVFQTEVLAMIREMGDELLLKVPYADSITSLTEVDVSVGNEEGIAVVNPVGDIIPSDPQTLQNIRNFVLSRSSLVNKLVSEDGTETWISLSLREYPEEGEWKKTGKDPMYEAGEAAIAVVTDPRWVSDAYTIKAAGMPYTETEERDFMATEASTRVISGFAVMILLLTVFLRSFRGVAVPLFTTGAGIGVVFGTMGWLNIGIDSMLMTLPLLLGMALSVGYSIHLVNSFKRLFRQGKSRREAIISAVEKTGWPILFTVLTTIGSMCSFAFIRIEPVRWLGLTCAALVLAVFLYVIILIPILFSFGRDYYEKGRGFVTVHSRADKAFLALGDGVMKRSKLIIMVFVLLAVAAVPGILKIEVNMDSFKFMGLKIPYIRRLHSIVNSQLGSYLNYNVTVKFDDPDAVKEPEVLKHFDSLLGEIGRFDLTKKTSGVPKIFSLLDIVKDMNQTLNGDNGEYYKIPDSRDLIAQILFLYEISGGSDTYQWVDEEYSLLRAQVEISRFDSSEVASELEVIDRMGRELFPEAELTVVGSVVRFARLNDKIVIAELKSFLIALVIIGMLLALVFTSFSTGLIGLIPNISPVLVIGGVMGYFNFQLDMMTMIIMPMLLGIAVDDTIHFINQIKYEFERCGDYRQSVSNALVSIGKTLAMTTVILSFSFAAYSLSPVQTMRNVGILGPLGLCAALVADYTMTPALILLTKPFGKEYPGDKTTNDRKITAMGGYL